MLSKAGFEPEGLIPKGDILTADVIDHFPTNPKLYLNLLFPEQTGDASFDTLLKRILKSMITTRQNSMDAKTMPDAVKTLLGDWLNRRFPIVQAAEWCPSEEGKS